MRNPGAMQPSRSPIGYAVQWFRDWSRKHACPFELEQCGKEEVEHIARDLGITASELRALAAEGPDAADALYRRMSMLRLDPVELGCTQPAVLGELQKLCTLCKSHKRCAADLIECPADSIWLDYCPNALTLREIVAAKPMPSEFDELIVYLRTVGASEAAKGGAANSIRDDLKD